MSAQTSNNKHIVDELREKSNSPEFIDVSLRALLSDAADALEWANDTPSVEHFMKAVQDEIDHQRKRWGKGHDHSKHLFDWMALANRLLGKMVDAQWNGDDEKVLHHVITLAAVMGNCHASMISNKRRK